MEMNKTVHDLEMDVECVKETQMEESWRWKSCGGERNGRHKHHNRIQEREEIILDAEYTTEVIDISVKKNIKSKSFLKTTNQKQQQWTWE